MVVATDLTEAIASETSIVLSGICPQTYQALL